MITGMKNRLHSSCSIHSVTFTHRLYQPREIEAGVNTAGKFFYLIISSIPNLYTGYHQYYLSLKKLRKKKQKFKLE